MKRFMSLMSRQYTVRVVHLVGVALAGTAAGMLLCSVLQQLSA